MLKLYDYKCDNCGKVEEHLVHSKDELVVCPVCGISMFRVVSGGRTLEVIIPSYPGCKKAKAGYVHTHGDRPGTKIQSGWTPDSK